MALRQVEREIVLWASGDGDKPSMRAQEKHASLTFFCLGRASDGPSESWMVLGEQLVDGA